MERTIRTDLAIELRENIKDRGELDGIEIATRVHQDGIKTTTIHVVNQKGAETLGKPVGTYVTIECPQIKRNLMKAFISRFVQNFLTIWRSCFPARVPSL